MTKTTNPIPSWEESWVFNKVFDSLSIKKKTIINEYLYKRIEAVRKEEREKVIREVENMKRFTIDYILDSLKNKDE